VKLDRRDGHNTDDKNNCRYAKQQWDQLKDRQVSAKGHREQQQQRCWRGDCDGDGSYARVGTKRFKRVA